MRYAPLSLLMAAPAMAHTGDTLHAHPHDGASWLAVVGLLAASGLGGWALARIRSGK